MVNRTITKALNQVGRVPWLYDVLSGAKRNLLPKQTSELHQFFEEYSRRKRDKVSFLQLGANDGLSNDPIRYFVVWRGWTGVLVEPILEAFELLQANYRLQKKRLRFTRAAVTVEANDFVDLYRIDASKLSQLSRKRSLRLLRKTSFSKQHVEKFLLPSEREFIIRERVSAAKINELWSDFGSNPVPDVMLLDLEGYERILLLEHNFRSWSPEVIVFEAAHIPAPEKALIVDRLQQAGYRCRDAGVDMIALKGGD